VASNHYLLLGAGFSRNYGGLTASEFFDYLIANSQIREDHELLAILWRTKDKGGFEAALAELQRDFVKHERNEDRLFRLQAAISEVFDVMNQVLIERDLGIEFQTVQEMMVRAFFFKFDAIFTLNQDVLLEHHYVKHIDLSAHSAGSQLPGLRMITDTPGFRPNPSWGTARWISESTNFRIEKNCQPIVKLHGSSNWQDEDNQQLLVMVRIPVKLISDSGFS
jgi:hypothetical protein